MKSSKLLAQSIDSFKCMLEEYKFKSYIHANVIDTGNFWELSNEVLDRIEGSNYVELRIKKFITSI